MKVCDVVLNSVWHDPRVRKQIAEYMAQGVELSCVGKKCNRYDEEKIKEIPCKTVIVMPDPRYEGKQRSVFKKLKRERIWQEAVRDAIVEQKPDIIHANDLNALIPAYMAKKILNCKLVYDSHEIYVENNFLRDKRLYARVLKFREKRICKKVDQMICVSHAAADYFANEYNIPKPMVVTNCSLKSEQCFADKKNDGFEVLNHGQFYEGRGYDVMLEAIPLLKDFPEIKLALRGFGKLEDQLRSRAKDLGDENVRFYPPVHVSQLIPEASGSMVGVAITEAICLNFKLSVSNKLFEYASAGLPVIMSDIPEHRYLNEKYEFGIIIPDDTPKSFADAVIKLYSDKEFYNKCAENAKRLSEDVNWENEFAKLIEVERALVERK
ncbi:MAG: glycosyltransferase family 4 protein [Clostridia bacterium]|nr:glycosyltransferase family 4 protein [Clostridia bacterium]